MKFKKGILPYLVVMIVAIIMMDFGKGEIAYEYITYESLTDRNKQRFYELGPGFTGLFEDNKYSYAFIATNPDEKAVVEFVGKAHDGIGKEVRYKVVKKGEDDHLDVMKGQHGKYTLCLIRLESKISTPFGFYNTNEFETIDH